jgi:ribosomal-protein-alanine N-acetyltransferase
MPSMRILAPRRRLEQPEIPAGRLTLRPWEPADVLQVVKAFGDPEIREWHGLALETEEAARQWMACWDERWRARTGAGWAIAQTADPEKVLGQVAFRALYLDAGMAECSYWVIPDYRGGGIAPEATRALSDWAFKELGLYRLEIVHSVRNRRSCRVALKAGFTPEGIKRSLQWYEHGGVHDMHLHARVRPAETRARPWDRALLGIVSNATLWTSASLVSAGSALLASVHRLAAVVPLVGVAAVLLLRELVVDRPLRKHQRRLADAGRIRQQ